MKKSILRNTLSLALCAALMLTLLPVTALAADGTISTGDTYDLIAYGNGSVITISTTQPVTLRGNPTVTYTNMQINCIVAGVSLTLSNVNIDNSSTGAVSCALAFTGVGNTLALEGSSTLTSGFNFPGVRVANDTELTISDGAGAGTGQLTATGGDYGGGIGGGSGGSGGSVTISGGTVTATGNGGGAGIGGGCGGNGGSVTIRGGTVTATGVNGGAGIGGGRGGHGGTVTITGGTVTATGGCYGAGIGGGQDGDGGSVAISGGTVRAAAGDATNGTNGHAIGGGGFYGSGGSIGASGTCVITGGTVKAETGGMGPVPTNGSAQVYLTTVTLNGAGIAAVSALTTETAGYTYGINDMKTDASGKLYLYLPVSTNTTAAGTATTHYGKSTITTSSSSTPASGTLWPHAFSVTGGTANYTYGDDGVLTFTQNGTYTVAMAAEVTQTTTDRIVVASGVTANITLSGVDIDVSSINQCAFDMTGATVDLTLAGTNSLKSSGPYAGLGCPDGAYLTIGGTGSLTAEKFI